jgi:uncharacterized membrane protein YbhN (UPF0104 family)
MNIRAWIQYLLVALLVGLSSWWVFRQADVEQMMDHIASVSAVPLILAGFVVLASHVVRAFRWRMLLPSENADIGLWPLFSAVMIGYAWNTIVPRSGEVIRPFILARRGDIDLSVSLTSVIVERILDVLTLIVGVLAVGVVSRDVLTSLIPSATMTSITVTLATPLAFFALAFILALYTPLGSRVAFIGKAIRSIRSLTGVMRWTSIGLSTIVLWLLYAVPLLFIAQALAIPHPASIAQAFLLLVVVSIGVTVAPTPGAIGIYHAFCSTALSVLFGCTPTQGMAYAMVAWLVNYGLAVVLGGACFMWELRGGITMEQMRNVVRNAKSS